MESQPSALWFHKKDPRDYMNKYTFPDGKLINKLITVKSDNNSNKIKVSEK